MNVTQLLRNEATLTVCWLGQVSGPLALRTSLNPQLPSISPIPGSPFRGQPAGLPQGAGLFALLSEYLHQELFMCIWPWIKNSQRSKSKLLCSWAHRLRRTMICAKWIARKNDRAEGKQGSMTKDQRQETLPTPLPRQPLSSWPGATLAKSSSPEKGFQRTFVGWEQSEYHFSVFLVSCEVVERCSSFGSRQTWLQILSLPFNCVTLGKSVPLGSIS